MPRVSGHHIPGARIVFFAAESAVLFVAARAGWALGAGGEAGSPAAALAALACAVAVHGAFYLADLYDLRVASDDARAGRRLLGALGGISVAAVPLALAAPPAAREALPWALAAAGAGAAALRAAAPWRSLCRRLFVVGSGAAAASLDRELEAAGDDVVVGRCEPDAPDLTARVRASGAGVVVIACDERRGLPSRTLLELRLAGLEVLEAVRYVERTRRKLAVDLVRPATLIFDDGFRRSRGGDGLRRLLSLATALLVGIVTLPVALLAALAIRLDSPGPALYRQARVGRGGRAFTLWKFRTMRADAESTTGAVWAREHDARVTRIGGLLRRYRIDELPQLLNVLAGDMDLVGPRPERPEFVAKLTRRIPYFELRTLVRPGLTGWAQIRWRYGASVDDARHKLGYDLYYVKHASAVLDVIVLFHTAKVVLTGRGAR